MQTRPGQTEGNVEMRTTTRRTAIIGTSVIALMGAGVAFAAWTATGTGSGSATGGTAVPLVVTVGTVSNLYPTGTVQVGFTVKNNNPYAVTLAGGTPSGFAVDAGHSTCNIASISGSAVVLSDVILAGGTSPSHNVPVSMSNAAVDACQGATFTFNLTVNGASS
jgi:hypothetical protein